MGPGFDSPHGNTFFFSFLFIEQLPRCTNQIFLCAIQVNFLGSIVVSISACHAEDRGSIPHRGDNFFPHFFPRYRERKDGTWWHSSSSSSSSHRKGIVSSSLVYRHPQMDAALLQSLAFPFQ